METTIVEKEVVNADRDVPALVSRPETPLPPNGGSEPLAAARCLCRGCPGFLAYTIVETGVPAFTRTEILMKPHFSAGCG